MTISLMPAPLQRFINNAGLPAARFKLYTFAAGTSTPMNAWQDPAGLVPHENPITLDMKGEALVYFTDANYKIDLRDPVTGQSVSGYPVDNFPGFKQGEAAQYETQTALAGQKTFTLANISYTPGISSLHVYLDGLRVTPADYVETSAKVVTFKQALIKGQEVLFEAGSAVNSSLLADAATVPYTPAGGVATNVAAILDKFNVTNGVFEHSRTGPTDRYQTAGQLFRTENTGGAGYALRVNFKQSGTVTGGFAIGMGSVCEFPGVNGGQGLASWLVAATPYGTANTFGVFGQEVNPMNRSSDSGYSKRRGALTRWTGGIQVVPESQDLVGGQGPVCYNVTYGFAVACSGTNKADGTPAKAYNAYLCEQNAVAPGGRAYLAAGDSTGVTADLPLAAFDIDQRFKFGLRLRDGVFDQGRAVLLGNDQWIAMENAAGSIGFKIMAVNTNDDVVIAAAKAGGEIKFTGNSGAGPSPVGASSFTVLSDAAATAYLRAEASTGTTAIATLSAQSSTLTNVDVQIKPKGTGIPRMTGLRDYADDAAAAAGGIPITGLYRSGSIVKIRVA